MKIYPILLLIAFVLFSTFTHAQKVVRARGESGPIRIESSMTEDETRQKAKELAIINAIEKEFGTYVEQQTDILIESGRESFNIIGGTKVKGFWVETSKGYPKYNEQTENISGKYGKEIVNWIECVIEGRVKKITPRAQLDFETLNCPDVICRTTEYISGESFYLYFKSPVDGYLSVFLDVGSTTYRLLPYNKMDENNRNAVRIEEDNEYVFFSKDHRYFEGAFVDEQELFTKLDTEYNYIYLIFATEPFQKPLLNEASDISTYKDDYILPKSLTTENFIAWLADNRATMDSFQDIKMKIRIKK